VQFGRVDLGRPRRLARFGGIEQRFKHQADARQNRPLDTVERLFEAILRGVGCHGGRG